MARNEHLAADLRDKRLLWIPLDKLHRHPANPNVMSDELLDKLARNIAETGGYQPIVVRPHPVVLGEHEILNGEQRCEVLARQGADSALCFEWPCSDENALLLLATLNRLHGEEVPVLRAAVLKELTDLLPADLVATLLPESPREIERTLALAGVDGNALLADLTAATHRAREAKPRVLSFAVAPDELAIVQDAISIATSSIDGRNRRGRALAAICAAYLEQVHA